MDGFRVGVQVAEAKELSWKCGVTFPSHLAPPAFLPPIFGPASSNFQLGGWSTQGHAEGGHLLNFQDSFQACLFQERSIIELADINLVTVCKAVHWKPVTYGQIQTQIFL